MRQFVVLFPVLLCTVVPVFAQSTGQPGTGWHDSNTAVQNDIPFVTVGNHSGATAERAISVGSGLSYTDNGANSTWVIELGPILSYYYSTGATTQQTAADAIFNFPSKAAGDVFQYDGTHISRIAKGANGTFLGVSGGTLGYYTPSGSGTVTSVDVAGTSGGELTFSGGPVTGSGTITAALANQTTNKVLAAPNGSTGTPTFRLLVAADIPNLAASKITSGNLAKSVSATEGVYTDQSNTYSTGTQDFSNSDVTLKVPTKSDPVSPATAEVWLSTDDLKFRDTGATRTVATTNRTETLSNKTLASPKVTTKITFDGTHDTDITFTDPAANAAYNVPDVGTTGTFSINDGTNTAYGTIYNDSAGRQKTASPGTAGYVYTSNGAGAAPTFQVSSSVKGLAGGYLTAESGVAGSTSDQTNKSTIYYTPDYTSQCPGQIDLWNGSTSVRFTFTELSLDVTGLTADKNYDIWVYDSSGATLTSTAWTNDTTRATALALTSDGYYVKTGDTGKRYVGTIRTYSPSSNCRAIDSAGQRYIWNLYNPKRRKLFCGDTTDTWTYATAAWRPFNNSSTYGTGRVGWVCGLAGTSIDLRCKGEGQTSGSSAVMGPAIGIDSTSAVASGCLQGLVYPTGSTYPQNQDAHLIYESAIGFHYASTLEWAQGGNTNTFYGDTSYSGGPGQSGMTGATWQ